MTTDSIPTYLQLRLRYGEVLKFSSPTQLFGPVLIHLADTIEGWAAEWDTQHLGGLAEIETAAALFHRTVTVFKNMHEDSFDAIDMAINFEEIENPDKTRKMQELETSLELYIITRMCSDLVRRGIPGQELVGFHRYIEYWQEKVE